MLSDVKEYPSLLEKGWVRRSSRRPSTTSARLVRPNSAQVHRRSQEMTDSEEKHERAKELKRKYNRQYRAANPEKSESWQNSIMQNGTRRNENYLISMSLHTYT